MKILYLAPFTGFFLVLSPLSAQEKPAAPKEEAPTLDKARKELSSSVSNLKTLVAKELAAAAKALGEAEADKKVLEYKMNGNYGFGIIDSLKAELPTAISNYYKAKAHYESVLTMYLELSKREAQDLINTLDNKGTNSLETGSAILKPEAEDSGRIPISNTKQLL